jgi:hypothetical protein
VSGHSFSRRRLINSTALISAGAFLNACVRRIPTGGLPPSNSVAPLTIDVHCHFFNGTDLQMEKFIEHVQNATGEHPGDAALAPLAQSIDWKFAPNGKSEMHALRAGQISQAEAHTQRDKARRDAYKKFRQQLGQPKVAANLSAAPATSPQATSAAKVQSFIQPKTYAEHAPAKLVGGTLPALEEYFQYRYVALADYLNLYNSGTDRTIDLVIAHLVDYDWPLNDGKPTRTKLDDQVKLMERISVLSDGRVHTFAPFDPFREIAFKAGLPNARWSSLAAVQNWVDEHGCIGVKIYPPMGFAPFGNSQISPTFWKGKYSWLGDPGKVRDGQGGYATLGERLDAVLGQLYSWCLANDIPVMSHTDLSNGLSTEFDQFPAAKYWILLRSHPQFSRLRINLGHMGGLEDTHPEDWSQAAASGNAVNAQALVALMSADSDAPGGRFYGDSGYSEKILSSQADVASLYLNALQWKAPEQPRPLLPDRLMYGSDWSLLMLESDMQNYFTDFVSLYSQLDKSIPQSPKTLSQKFFSDNAVDYLGLRSGRTSDRLTTFYSTRGMTFDGRGKPAWMEKIT